MAPPQPLILLPPSEGKAPGGDGAAWRAGTLADAALDRHRRTVLRVAHEAGSVRRRGGTLPALERYTGVLYRELDWASLPAAARRRGEAQVRIASGLWGLVAPTDPIPAYRLKMSAALADLGRLSTWWRPRLESLLVERTGGALVWDLLPIEHAAAMDWSRAEPRQRVTVRFIDAQDRTVSHWNKLLKGSLVRWILSARPTGVDDLVGFDHPLGYRFDASASTVDGPLVAAVLRQAP